METTFTILKAIAFTSIIASTLLLSAKLYAYYARKEDECSDDCSCQANRVNDQITDSVTVEKPKRKQVKKRVSAIKDDKLVITPVEEKPKRGRKKKS
jgi:hypothetical protein